MIPAYRNVEQLKLHTAKTHKICDLQQICSLGGSSDETFLPEALACFQTGLQSMKGHCDNKALPKDCKSAWATLRPASGTAPGPAAAGGAFSWRTVGQIKELLVWETLARGSPTNAGNEHCITVSPRHSDRSSNTKAPKMQEG